jgi:hypothetical protein
MPEQDPLQAASQLCAFITHPSDRNQEVVPLWHLDLLTVVAVAVVAAGEDMLQL